ncbi:MAG: glycosyltransferase family 9 protein, partial [Nitrospiria bacterium]
LNREGVPVVITSGEEHSKIPARFVGEKRKGLFLAPSFCLKELAALYRSCRVVAAGDTGPLHLAVAVGRPTVGLFGPSDASRSGPYGKGHRVVQRRCICRAPSPYAPRRCRQKSGCIEGIEVEEVFDSVTKILKEDICR